MTHGDAQEVGKWKFLLEGNGLRGGVGREGGREEGKEGAREGRRVSLWSMYINGPRRCPGGRKKGVIARGRRSEGRGGGKEREGGKADAFVEYVYM